MIPLSIAQILESSETKPPGYAQDIISHGLVHGELLYIEDSVYTELLHKYQPHRFRGLGDAVKWVTDKLSIPQCQGCKERQDKLNALVPFR